VVRLRHIGTGKYLAIDEQDRQNLVLHDRANNLDCLFMLRADMAPKKELKYNYEGEAAGKVVGEPSSSQGQVRSSQRVMIQSWKSEDYLQIVEETQSKEEKAFKNVVTHINDQFVDPEQQKDSQVRLINHKFQKIEKFRMMFEVEEVDLEKARQAYQSSYIFDEMLEYYAFLNCWAAAPIDMATEAAEQHYYKHDLAVARADDLHDSTSKMLMILQNIEERLKKFEDDPETYSKSKTQLQEQGILDVLCRILDIIYYKSTPPPMFQKPFKSSKTET
jgi:hypothetical protein